MARDTSPWRARQRREIADGMAAARRWRLASEIYAGMHPVIYCLRCDGSGRVWWCGRPGMGGRPGPCPRCQVDGAARFRAGLNRELFA